MDGRNSTGRKVSLLNDSRDDSFVAPARSQPFPVKLPSLRTFNSFSPSSAPSSRSLSPQTPPLIRSESSDSRQFASASPVTPQSTSFENGPQLHNKQAANSPRHQSYYLYRPGWNQKMDDPTLFPIIPEGTTITGFPLPNMTGMQQPRMRSSDSPVSESHISNISATSASKPNGKKNQYPCPLAKQYKCSDFFTTSGHAARHAKKHTGRKDAVCPECNKAFTRKDNMEQHRRTHQNVRGPTKATDSKVKKPTKTTARKADKSVNSTLEAAVNQQLEEQQVAQMTQANQFSLPNDTTLAPALIPGGGPYFMSADPIGALPQPMTTDFSGRPPLYRANYTNALDFTTTTMPPTLQDPDLHFSYPSPGLSNGLNTLALAASGHRRLNSDDRRASEESTATTQSTSADTSSESATP